MVEMFFCSFDAEELICNSHHMISLAENTDFVIRIKDKQYSKSTKSSKTEIGHGFYSGGKIESPQATPVHQDFKYLWKNKFLKVYFDVINKQK